MTAAQDDPAKGLEAQAIELVRKYGDPNGTDYEQGQNDMGHRMVTLAQEATRQIAERDARAERWKASSNRLAEMYVPMRARALAAEADAARVREALLNAVIALEALSKHWPEDHLPPKSVCIQMADAINNGNVTLTQRGA